MICKNADSKVEAIATLERLQMEAPADRKSLIERELRILRAGIKGEQEAAYLIDFQLKDSQKTAVIHDLRLQLEDGRVAQIDHLLIHWTLRFYILETKHFSHGVKITDEGEFLRWNDWKKTYEGMASPIEQNERHAAVLRAVLSKFGLGGTKVESMILISPQARIDRSKRFNSDMVVKADQFLTAMQKNLDNASFLGLLSGFAKTTFTESIGDIARNLIQLHRPMITDYTAKFGMTELSNAYNNRLGATQLSRSADLPPLVPITAPPPSAIAADMAIPFDRPASSTPVALLIVPSQLGQGHHCRKCRATDISIQYGKFGYYFKCGICDGNTPIKLNCGKEGHKERLRKEGLKFYRECAECQISAMYFINPQMRSET